MFDRRFVHPEPGRSTDGVGLEYNPNGLKKEGITWDDECVDRDTIRKKMQGVDLDMTLKQYGA